MSLVRRLQARAQRWHLLGRYYVNKWHYDGSKWAERVWYGQGSTGGGPQVASVAFMITRAMRQQLAAAGFPPSAISALQPAVAQQILGDKLSFAQFQELQRQQQVQQAAERAKQALKQEDEQHSALVAAEVKHAGQEQPATAALLVQQETQQCLPVSRHDVSLTVLRFINGADTREVCLQPAKSSRRAYCAGGGPSPRHGGLDLGQHVVQGRERDHHGQLDAPPQRAEYSAVHHPVARPLREVQPQRRAQHEQQREQPVAAVEVAAQRARTLGYTSSERIVVTTATKFWIEFDELYEQNSDPLPLICVQGSSGMGKTQLAFTLEGRRPYFYWLVTAIGICSQSIYKNSASISSTFRDFVRNDNPAQQSEQNIVDCNPVSIRRWPSQILDCNHDGCMFGHLVRTCNAERCDVYLQDLENADSNATLIYDCHYREEKIGIALLSNMVVGLTKLGQWGVVALVVWRCLTNHGTTKVWGVKIRCQNGDVEWVFQPEVRTGSS
ncbi:unnamed protein product [Phytophthora lilii]|uniref:Unnamed protein product n=1 Tax=Phytophthora lilii TaxID=2077276 RepID=A0A9W7D8P3_9STRA|nr:unnamed protein product [Phytophthora lilii]